MLLMPPYPGGKSGGKIQAASNRAKPVGAGFTGLQRCLEWRGGAVGSVLAPCRGLFQVGAELDIHDLISDRFPSHR